MSPRGRPDPTTAVRQAVAAALEPLSERPLGELGLAGEVSRRSGGTHVTVAGLDEDPGYRAALEANVSAALRPAGVHAHVRVAPADDSQRREVARVLRGSRRSPGGLGSPTRLFAVASGKGGVGKSTVTTNLAAALAVQGLRVGVLDADVWGYSQTLLFGVRRAPVAVPGLMFPVRAHGVRLMSVGFFVDDDEPVVWRGPMLHKALEQFLEDVYWGDLDVLLVDLPPGTGDVSLSVLELLPDAAMLLVTTPQIAAESVAGRVGRMARNARMPVAGVVETMSGGAFGSGGGARLADQLTAPLLGTIPLDAAVCAAGDAGEPLVVASPEHPAAQALRQVADSLPSPRRSLVGRSLPLFVATR
ncbi:Mrp/NBP35 family ATP-binding protein [Nocardioides sp.]|uniref:Mrp/NBP35 family ATP-binding protein n=1 Tax=Nocardioides sp. TaxID=35761 RepID=UPI002ED2E5D5